MHNRFNPHNEGELYHVLPRSFHKHRSVPHQADNSGAYNKKQVLEGFKRKVLSNKDLPKPAMTIDNPSDYAIKPIYNKEQISEGLKGKLVNNSAYNNAAKARQTSEAIASSRRGRASAGYGTEKTWKPKATQESAYREIKIAMARKGFTEKASSALIRGDMKAAESAISEASKFIDDECYRYMSEAGLSYGDAREAKSRLMDDYLALAFTQ